MLPENTTTYSVEAINNITVSVINTTTPFKVLGISMQQERDLSDTIVQCDGVDIAVNYGKDFPYVPMNVGCNSTLDIVKTGQDESFSIINVLFGEPINPTVIVDINASTSLETNLIDGVYSVSLGISILVAVAIVMLILWLYD